jgi:glycosyltransferase involved in cell wall biosynthesis
MPSQLGGRGAQAIMRILCLYGSVYPWDVRLEKLGASCAAAGHEFHLLCANFDARARRERAGSVEVHRLPALDRGPSALSWGLSLPVHANPVWALSAAQVMRRVRPDLVMARDLHVALIAWAAARAARAPMVLDLAENWPFLLSEWKRFENPSAQNLLFRNAWMSWAVELVAVHAADHVVVVVDEMAERLRAKGVPGSRMTVVTNVPAREQARVDEAAAAANRERLGEGLKIIYTGEISGFRGLEVALRAMPLVIRAESQARLVIVGRGKPVAEERVTRLVAELGIGDAVVRPGWVPRGELATWMATCDVGLAPFRASKVFDATISNKIFDYMSIGLPVVATAVRPVARILRETGAGVAVPPDSPRALAEAMLSLRDARRRRELGERGRQAVRRRYNWEQEGARFVSCIERVAQKRVRGSRPKEVKGRVR